MFLFFLPAAQTRQIRFKSLLLAAFVGQIIGAVIATLVTQTMAGCSAFLISIVLTSVVSLSMVPVVVLLAWLSSRIGAFGYLTSLAAGPVLANTTLMIWGATQTNGQSPATGELYWYAASVGLFSAAAFWLFLRRRFPEVFASDLASGTRLGWWLYAALPFAITFALPYILPGFSYSSCG